MSYNQTYRNPPDNMYSDSQCMYPRESSAYRSRIRTTSSEHTPSSSEAPVLPTGKALSFLHSCGLDAEDLKSLADLPEHLITAETLPDLLAEIKKKKTVNTSSSRSGSSARSWEDRSHTQPVEYPFDFPVRQSYHREQVPTWEDPWGNVQKTGLPTRSYTSSESNFVIEYNHLKDKEFYFDKAPFAAEQSRQKTSVASQSYSNYSREDSQPSHLYSRANSQPSQPSSRDVSQSSHLSSRDIGIPSLLSSRNAIQPSHLSSRDSNQHSHHWRTEMVHKVPNKKEASDFHGKNPPMFPYECVLCEITVLSFKDWSVHIKGAQHANSQLSLVEKYPEWDQSVQSARRNELVPEISQPRATQGRGGTSGSRNRLSGSRSGLSSIKNESSSNNQKKTEERCKVVCIKFETDEVDEKYLKKLLGQFGPIVRMIMFPRLAFTEMGSAEQADDIVRYFLLNPLRIKGQLLEFTLSAASSFLQSSCVVSFSPLPVGEGISSELIAIAKRFGSVKHSLFLPSRGYVEMANPQEAKKLVEHYSTNSLKLKGKTINVCFSSEYKTLGETGDKKEISPISKSSNRRRRRSASPQRRFHSSRKVSPSPKRRSSRERSRSRRSYDSKKQDNRRRSRERTKESSRRESSRRDSSSKSHSRKSPSKDQGKKTEESAKEKIKEEINDNKNQSDTMEDNSKDQSDNMEDDMKDQSNTMEDETKDQSDTMEDDANDQSDTMDEDGDLEGVAVIADDGEALISEDDELAEDAEPEDQAQDASVYTNEPETSEDMPGVEQSKDQTIPSGMAVSNVHSETSEPLPNATTTSGSSDFKEAQELKQEQEAQKDQTVVIEEEVAKFPENLENHVTLDEFEEVGKDHVTEQGDDQEILVSSSEEKFGKVLEVTAFPVAKKYTEIDLLNIGKKYGDVLDCCLVRNNGKVEKALIEMVNSTDTAKIEAESSKKKIKLGGRILRITVSKTYTSVKQGKCVDSEFGKVESEEQDEEIDKELSHSETSCEESSGMLQEAIKSSEEGSEAPVESTIDTVVQTSSDEEGLIEMENASDAEKVVAVANMNKITIAGKHPKIAVSTKHTNLNKRHFLHRPSDGTVQTTAELEGAEDGSKTQNNISDQLSESLNVKESSNDEQGVNLEGDEKQLYASDDGTEMMVENSDSSGTQTLLNNPVGTEFVRPVVGYFCSLCNAIYASEEEAKNEHCRTALHHQKLKEHMEQKVR
ncbi:matrin 3-like 1.1 [Xyrauchen texanus]|uniref:matrin 3-like 1.1 n=1 Tax=Xyrauchen texanus TaxID=154827 RepID=UPI00224243B3|nr:matrin 3-like 1.1 [Xyrauchen texanus]